MPRKGKKRREAQRERKEHLRAERETEAAAGGTARSEVELAKLARAKARAEHEAERLRRKQKAARKAGGGAGFPVNPWYIGTPIVLILVAVGAYFVFSGGGGGEKPQPPQIPDPPPGAPTSTKNIQAIGEESGSTFVPDTLTIKAGEIVEIVLTNVAERVSHNLRVSGEDSEYDTDDDWFIPIVKKGEVGRLIFKIDKAGTYPFQCDFHPQTQKGTLTVTE